MESAPLTEMIGRFPTTFSQQSFLFRELAKPGDPELNIAVRWEICGKFSGPQLEKAVQRIIQRHEILRTRFIVDNGEGWQEVVESVPFRLGMVDLRAVASEEHESRVAAMARELANRPFDLSQPCLLRMTLVQLAADRAAILISAHHIVFDGFSIGVLGHELGQIMQALAERRDPDLPELDLQYGDYALWEQEFEASGALEEDGSFWESRLKDAPYFELEPDFLRPAGRETTGKTIVKAFPTDFDERMVAFNKSSGISLFTFGAAALSAALHQWSGKTDILFATPVAGRTDVEIERLIGVFINTLVVRIDAQPDASLREHVGHVADLVTEALLHQSYPFDRLVRRLKPRRDASRRPLVSINLNMQRAFLQERRYGDFELVSVPSHMPGIFYDLNVQIVGRNSGWKLMLDYNTSLFTAETAEAFADFLLQTFEAVLRDPETRLADLPRQQTAIVRPVPATPVAKVAPQSERLVSDHSDIRAELQRIWSEVLGRPPSDCEGDFFELGGHSLVALRMLARAQESFGQRLSLGAFLEDPKLDALTETIARVLEGAKDHAAQTVANAELWDVLPLRAAVADSPVIVTVNQPFLYHAFARQISEGVEVINLTIAEEHGLTRLAAKDFATLAADAADLLCARYAGRPIALMGHCVDGLLALRIAQQEALARESIILVGMIDPLEPVDFVRRGRFEGVRARWSVRLRRWGHYLGAKLRGQIGWADLLRQTGAGEKLLRRFGAIAPETEAERHAFAVNHRLVQMSQEVSAEPFDGDVALFKTEAHTDAALRGSFGWSRLLPADTPVYQLPGWHQDALMTTGVEKIAQIVQARIARRMKDASRHGG